MDVTPNQLIDEVEFREVRKGYDPAEVDAFLDRIAAAMDKLHQQVTEATDRARAAEAKLASVSDAPRPAPVADDTSGTEQLQRTLVLAQRTADAAVKEAQEEAEALRAEARAESTRILSDAQAAAERTSSDARESSLGELRDLETVRTSLQNDIALLQAHVDAHREVLGGSIAELQRWLDDPAAFRVSEPAPLSAATVASVPPASPAPAADPVTSPAPAPVAIADEVPEPEPEPVVSPVAQLPLEPAPVAPTPAPAPVVETPAEPAAPVEPEAPRARVDGPPPSAPVDELIDLGAPSPVVAAPKAADVADEADSSGPATEAFDVLAPAQDEDDDDDDAFLAELRKAMTDDEPLGPRDDDDGSGRFPFEDRASHSRPRFGRRR